MRDPVFINREKANILEPSKSVSFLVAHVQSCSSTPCKSDCGSDRSPEYKSRTWPQRAHYRLMRINFNNLGAASVFLDVWRDATLEG